MWWKNSKDIEDEEIVEELPKEEVVEIVLNKKIKQPTPVFDGICTNCRNPKNVNDAWCKHCGFNF